MRPVVALAILLTACGSPDTGVSDESGILAHYDCGGLPLRQGLLRLPAASNLESHEVEVEGGCFEDGATTATLYDEGGKEVLSLALVVIDAERLILTVPAGLTVGRYRIAIRRDDEEDNQVYDAISDTLVAGGNGEPLHVVDIVDATQPREILTLAPMDGPVMDFQGLRLYFSDGTAIWRADLLGGASPTRLTGDEFATVLEPDVSPAGDRIVFQGCVAGAPACDLYRIQPDSKGLERLTHYDDITSISGHNTLTRQIVDPVYSPDGSQIAWLRLGYCDLSIDPFCKGDPDYSSLVVMNADGSDKQYVWTAAGAHLYASLQWTRDGSLIWTGTSDGGTPSLFMRRPGGGAPVAILDAQGGSTWSSIAGLATSPLEDAFVALQAETHSLVRYTFSTGEQDVITDAGTLLWTPSAPGPSGWGTDWFTWRP